MRAWRRNPVRRICGRCGAVIDVGDAVLALTFAMSPSTTMWRCVACCGPAPDNLPELLNARPTLVDRLRTLLGTKPDWKARQSGEK